MKIAVCRVEDCCMLRRRFRYAVGEIAARCGEDCSTLHEPLQHAAQKEVPKWPRASMLAKGSLGHITEEAEASSCEHARRIPLPHLCLSQASGKLFHPAPHHEDNGQKRCQTAEGRLPEPTTNCHLHIIIYTRARRSVLQPHLTHQRTALHAQDCHHHALCLRQRQSGASRPN